MSFSRPPSRSSDVSPRTKAHGHGTGDGGPKGARNAAYKHGLHTAEAVAERRALAKLLRRARSGLSKVRNG